MKYVVTFKNENCDGKWHITSTTETTEVLINVQSPASKHPIGCWATLEHGYSTGNQAPAKQTYEGVEVLLHCTV
jgi:ribosomal protein L31